MTEVGRDDWERYVVAGCCWVRMVLKCWVRGEMKEVETDLERLDKV